VIVHSCLCAYIKQDRPVAVQETPGNSFEITMVNGNTVQLFHCDAAAMANIIPRASFGRRERRSCMCMVGKYVVWQVFL
jgi:hypothetical protein